MKHLFKPGAPGARSHAPALVLFHGTGGTEHDLLPLAERISPESAVLSLRGNVLENGMPRFFRRLAEGVFDEEDLIFRTKEVHDFLDEASVQYGLDRGSLVAVGYSNGANLAGSLLFHQPGALKAAILHHPMVPRRGIALPDLSGTPVFIGAGLNDPICPAAETEELSGLLERAGASVAVHWERFGHQLTGTEVQAAADWFRKHL
ncbi:phospholipase/carboxylesterase [Paenibacillus sp. UNCCL117]|uniref:alpha/beta hydrolase n=1 Tax=unclassified Paenibacillus TaxID=185978 RepID=UPI00088CEE23|nr:MULTISPECIES: alpha/beta hydrolase [unclassified Paenibacillus]SDE15035.1 phospholipase/carboxylesterase [Paenibacillus sp. cl123]SFW60778.1 phospholipase/carboxylesterase [Paenibacillus sp. UNCCL117]